jgi:hypothetical protein
MSKVSNGTKGKPGRPSLYTPELADEICYRLAEGKSLRSICEADDMPHWRTVMKWLFFDKHDGFIQQYARAREAQAEYWIDECQKIADEAEHDIEVNTEGATDRERRRINHEYIQRPMGCSADGR